MELQQAEQEAANWAKEHASLLRIAGTQIEAAYIWNPGGFVNQSYRLSDGETIRHVKFAHAHKAARLQQWRSVSDYLANHYHAPRLVQEVTDEILLGYSYGLVFEFIEGKPLSSISNPAPVIQKVLQAEVRETTQKRAKEIHLHAYSEYMRIYGQ